jgi:hypothetical protein
VVEAVRAKIAAPLARWADNTRARMSLTLARAVSSLNALFALRLSGGVLVLAYTTGGAALGTMPVRAPGVRMNNRVPNAVFP